MNLSLSAWHWLILKDTRPLSGEAAIGKDSLLVLLALRLAGYKHSSLFYAIASDENFLRILKLGVNIPKRFFFIADKRQNNLQC